MPRQTLLKWLKLALALGVLEIVAMAGIVAFINLSTQAHRYVAATDIPPHRVAIVFGAKVNPDHTLSPILKDRVDGGFELYRLQKVEKLLMSGDNSSAHYDEVTAMKDYAVGQGVRADDIVLDYAGFTTYNTCYRAQAVFGLSEAILVTQGYHMPRALYTCRSLGVQAVGLALPDFTKYPSLRPAYTMREWLADQKAWWEVTVSRPEPVFLGEPRP